MLRCRVSLCVLALYVTLVRGCDPGKQMLSSGGMSEYEKQTIVDSHNRLRQSVALGQISRQPPAADMLEMEWDEELAATAQRWADQCRTAHDSANDREVTRFPVGQNIAATWTTRPPTGRMDRTPDFTKQIHAWFNEVNSYGYRPMGYSHGTGHYSQLVWGETSKVGCGYSFYHDPSRGYTKLYVCNYGPGGNVIGAHPYKKGSPSCSSHGLADSTTYSGLCSQSYGIDSFNSIPGSSMGLSMYNGGSSFGEPSFPETSFPDFDISSLNEIQYAPLNSFNSMDRMSGIFGANSFYEPRKNGFKYAFMGR